MKALLILLALVAVPVQVFATVDVGVDTIVVPDGNISGFRWITPTVECHNYGDTAVGFTAWLRLQDTSGILGYHESLMVEGLAPGSETTLAFANWRVWGRSNFVWLAVCSTFAAGDNNQANDARHKPFSIGPPCI
jgi:hypothetical protein